MAGSEDGHAGREFERAAAADDDQPTHSGVADCRHKSLRHTDELIRVVAGRRIGADDGIRAGDDPRDLIDVAEVIAEASDGIWEFVRVAGDCRNLVAAAQEFIEYAAAGTAARAVEGDVHGGLP